MHSFSFPAKEKLKSSQSISHLFEQGKTIYSSPLRALWLWVPVNNISPVMIAFSVSKKLFRRAVDRNLLKRRMREAYRNKKNILGGIAASKEKTMHLILIYSKSEVLPYAEIEKGVENILIKLNRAFIED